MLWNYIYAFFVKNVFGGFLEEGGQVVHYSATYGATSAGTFSDANFLVRLFGIDLNVSNVLAFYATLISMIILIVICCLFIKKIYNICAHVIG